MSTDLPQYSFAFQPIIDVVAREVVSYEALIRGKNGESAGSIFARVPPASMHAFDEVARTKAIGLFSRLNAKSAINLNFLPRSLIESMNALQTTLDAANASDVALDRLVIEVTEDEVIDDYRDFAKAIDSCRRKGVRIAIDDFGTGYSGLNLLAHFQPDVIKLDIALLRNIEADGPRQAIVRALVQICQDLGIDVVAEGVETAPQCAWLRNEGICLFQGFLFAKPGFERLPEVEYPAMTRGSSASTTRM